MALASLVARYLQRKQSSTGKYLEDATAFVVDHETRPGSRDEAEYVTDILKSKLCTCACADLVLER